MLPPATASLYRSNQRRIAALLAALRREWAGMDADLDASWERVGPRLARLVAAAQLGAAMDGSESVGPTLAQTGHPVEPEAQVAPRALAGVASDGRDLIGLLRGAVVKAKIAEAESLGARLSEGQRFLELAAHRQVADAARAGSQLAIVARPGVGWVRMVNPPCCQNCALLAGRWYRWSSGFRRHHRCDCVHRAASEREPRSGWVEDVPIDQIKDLTDAQRSALGEGADLSKVVNAYRRRPMRTPLDDYLAAPGGRLTPDGIYARAASREQAIELLVRHGYLTS